MAIIVDKVQKRKDIALSCKELFIKKGINNVTISEVAKTAGIGKGTVYEYFKNKEDIVFEIVETLLGQHDIKTRELIDSKVTAKEKARVFFSFFYDKEDNDLREFYKEFVSISLGNSNDDIVEFKKNCSNHYFDWFEEIILDGIKNKEIVPEAQNLIQGMFVTAEGMFISSIVRSKKIDIETEIQKYFDSIFRLIEVK